MERRKIKKFGEYSVDKNGIIYDAEGNVVETFINACNYVAVRLNNRILTVAYIVAKTWINNPNNCICIAYKDGDYSNVKADNLIWYYEGAEEEETETIEIKQPKTKTECIKNRAVLQIDAGGNIIKEYDNVSQAAKELRLPRHYFYIAILQLNRSKKYNCYFIYKDEFEEKINQIENSDKTRGYIGKGIYKIDYNTSEIIEKYSSGKEAAQKLNKPCSLINGILQENNLQLEDYYLIREQDYNKYTIKDKLKNALGRIKNNKKYDRKALARAVIILDNNGNIIGEYSSAYKAAKAIGINSTILRNICSGKMKQKKDFYAIFKKDYNPNTIVEDIRKYREEQNNKIYSKYIPKLNKKVLQFDYDGNLVNEYESPKDAANKLGKCIGYIYGILTNNMKQTKDYYLVYEKNFNADTIKEEIRKAK